MASVPETTLALYTGENINFSDRRNNQKCITIGMFHLFGYLHEVCDGDYAI